MHWTSRDLAAVGGATEMMNREWAPCRHACPVHADVRTYIQHAAEGNWSGAVDVIRNHLAFSSVCGRVCHHPCETNCRRKDVDGAVAIREVKRFVSEIQGARGATVRKAAKQDKARVAVIGAGPAGMAAALELARRGYRPTVFEKYPVAGGIPVTAIPVYRLPRGVIQQDVEWIIAHGVEVKTGVEIGKDKSIEQLLKEGFEAVLVATGLASSRTLPLPGSDNKRVFPVLDFLREMSFDRKPDIGSDVLVIGGGNVAVDAARSALRLGAARVRMVCLEDEKEMPAWSWEQDEAKEEGISFIHRRGPVEVVVKDGKITGLKTRKVVSVFDAQKRFNPVYDDADVSVIECDTLVFAIGQAPDYGFLKGSGVGTDTRGRMNFNRVTQQTDNPRVFACGEIVTPPGSVVEACANGQRAARALMQFLSGQPVVLSDAIPPKIETIPCHTSQYVIRVPRTPVAVEAPETRKRSLAEVDHNYTDAQAVSEARRCMNCGGGAFVIADKCAACQTCVRVCPFDIPRVTDVARISSDMCQSCGLCVTECPGNAIVWRGYEPADIANRTAIALKEAGKADRKIVAFIGGFKSSAADWQGKSGDKVPGVAEIYLASTSRIGSQEILAALEQGADAVAVVSCSGWADRYPGAPAKTRRRVRHVRRMLREAGVGEDRVMLYEVAERGRKAIHEALADAAAKVQAAK